jgi:hypothetical protein
VQTPFTCRDSEHALLVLKSLTYHVAAYVSPGFRGTALQVLSRQGVDNGECSQTREDSEERESHCDRIENRKSGGKLEC